VSEAQALLLQAALSLAPALLLRAAQTPALLRQVSEARALLLRAAPSLAPAFRWEERAFRSRAWARSLPRPHPSL
jgi:hypothetical protein